MEIQTGYNGLTTLTPGLPAEAYYDQRQYDLEMRRIWQRNWVYVGRSTDTVMAEDAAVCELTQGGLRSAPHSRGLIMPEEYLIRRFHQWIADELARI